MCKFIRRLAFIVGAVSLMASAAVAAPGWSGKATDLNGRVAGLPPAAERSLVLFGFRHGDQDALDAWRRGLGLAADDARWVEVAYIQAPAMVRPMVEGGLRKRFATEGLRAHMFPVFAAPGPDIAQLGLPTDRPVVAVMDRSGAILAKATGPYDPAKRDALLAALSAN